MFTPASTTDVDSQRSHIYRSVISSSQICVMPIITQYTRTQKNSYSKFGRKHLTPFSDGTP